MSDALTEMILDPHLVLQVDYPIGIGISGQVDIYINCLAGG